MVSSAVEPKINDSGILGCEENTIANHSSSAAISCEDGQNVSFWCTADGIPVPSIVWLFQPETSSRIELISDSSDSNNRFIIEKEILTNVFYRRHVPDGLTSTLTIHSLNELDNGSYTCKADIGAGQVDINDFPFTLSVSKSKQLTTGIYTWISYLLLRTCTCIYKSGPISTVN